MHGLGATPLDDGRTEFRVWAPQATGVAVRVNGAEHELAAEDDGAWSARGRLARRRLRLRPRRRRVAGPVLALSAGRRPRPVARRRDPRVRPGPELRLDDLVIYELHVGTFTAEGTFEAAIPHLAGLRELGVTAIELMPVGTFPGDRNWGYDGVYIWAPHPVYGGPEGLARLVDAAHARRPRRDHGRRLQPHRPGRRRDRRLRAVLHRPARDVLGRRARLLAAGVREWAIQNAEL